MKNELFGVKHERVREFDVARVFAIIAMIAVHVEMAVLNYQNHWFSVLFNYLGSPFAAPIFMFILGANIFLSSNNSPKKLFIRGVFFLGVSLIFNVVCHALPFFILDFINEKTMYTENALHWIFAVDILTFAGLAFIFFAFVKKFKINNWFLVLFGIIASILNIILTNNFPIDFNSNVLSASVTSLFYNSSITGYFSFLSWIIFPIAGYIFIQILLKVKNRNRFYLIAGGISLIIYLICVFISYKWLPSLPFIEYKEEYSYYQMHPFNVFGNLAFCIAWISILHFVSKILPKAFDKHIARLNKNITSIFIIQWFIINYCLILVSNNVMSLNEWQFILCFIAVTIVADFIAWLFSKYRAWKVK